MLELSSCSANHPMQLNDSFSLWKVFMFVLKETIEHAEKNKAITCCHLEKFIFFLPLKRVSFLFKLLFCFVCRQWCFGHHKESQGMSLILQNRSNATYYHCLDICILCFAFLLWPLLIVIFDHQWLPGGGGEKRLHLWLAETMAHNQWMPTLTPTKYQE